MIDGEPAAGKGVVGDPRLGHSGDQLGEVEPGVGPEVGTIYKEIREGRPDEQVSRKQAKELRREAGVISDMERRYSSDGLSEPEQAELRNRAEVLRAVTNAKRLGTIK